MEKKKETKRFDLMEFGSALDREEMKKLMAGSHGGECTNQIHCKYGEDDPSIQCHTWQPGHDEYQVCFSIFQQTPDSAWFGHDPTCNAWCPD